MRAVERAASEKHDLLDFLRSHADPTIVSNSASLEFWTHAVSHQPVRTPKPKRMVNIQVLKIDGEDGEVALFHQGISGFLKAMPSPQAMGCFSDDRQTLATLKPGMKISAVVGKRGSDYRLEQIQITQEQRKSK